jgi:hypothetical protein
LILGQYWGLANNLTEEWVMTNKIKYDMNAEVTAKLPLGVFEVLRRLGVDPQPFIERHNLENLQADSWLPISDYLALLEDVQKNANNYYTLISVGSKIPELADKMPETFTLQDLFRNMNDSYHINHRNGEIGNYFVEFLAENHIRVIAQNPYPSDFDYGLVWGGAKYFAPKGTFVKVVRAESPSRLKGDDHCIYDITW